jgi:hypothetical protein
MSLLDDSNSVLNEKKNKNNYSKFGFFGEQSKQIS